MNDGARVWWVVIVLAVLHLTLRVAIGMGPAAPDFLTIALLLGSRRLGLAGGAGLGFAFGLLEDAFSLLSFGANTVAMTLTGILGGFTRDLFVGDSRLFKFSFILIGKLLRDAAYWVLADSSIRGDFVEQVAVFGSAQAVYAAIVGAIVLMLTGIWGEEER